MWDRETGNNQVALKNRRYAYSRNLNYYADFWFVIMRCYGNKWILTIRSSVALKASILKSARTFFESNNPKISLIYQTITHNISFKFFVMNLLRFFFPKLYTSFNGHIILWSVLFFQNKIWACTLGSIAHYRMLLIYNNNPVNLIKTLWKWQQKKTSFESCKVKTHSKFPFLIGYFYYLWTIKNRLLSLYKQSIVDIYIFIICFVNKKLVL